jgi:hypothetical protein
METDTGRLQLNRCFSAKQKSGPSVFGRFTEKRDAP